jgi:hypothetical protein
MPGLSVIRYVLSAKQRSRIASPISRRKGSLSLSKHQELKSIKKITSPAIEYQTNPSLPELNPETKRSFVKRMFNKELVYILMEDRKSSLISSVEAIRHFNSRLRI